MNNKGWTWLLRANDPGRRRQPRNPKPAARRSGLEFPALFSCNPGGKTRRFLLAPCLPSRTRPSRQWLLPRSVSRARQAHGESCCRNPTRWRRDVAATRGRRRLRHIISGNVLGCKLVGGSFARRCLGLSFLGPSARICPRHHLPQTTKNAVAIPLIAGGEFGGVRLCP